MHLMAESKNFLTPPVNVLVDRASALSAACDGWLRVIPLVPASTGFMPGKLESGLSTICDGLLAGLLPSWLPNVDVSDMRLNRLPVQ